MIEAVIFDMDGVIVDSESHWHPTERDFIKGLTGATVEEETMKKITGMTVFDEYSLLKGIYGLSISKEEFTSSYNEMANEIYKQKVSSIKGCLDLIKQLNISKFRLGIASSSPRSWIEIVTQRFGLSEYFDVIVSGNETERGKPDPEIFLKASQKLGKNPNKCLVIEDSENGVLAAKAAGMKCIGFKDHKSCQDLGKADYIVNKMEEISTLISRM